MQKVYCFAAPNSKVIQELAGTYVLSMTAWLLPDNSGELVVCEPRLPTLRAHLETMSAQGVTVLPGPTSTTPLTAAQATLLQSIPGTTGALAADIYDSVAALTKAPQFSPHT